MKYYTLFTRDKATNTWSPQFGDYDRSTVIAERDDYRRQYRARDLWVSTLVDDTQLAADCEAARLNALSALTALEV